MTRVSRRLFPPLQFFYFILTSTKMCKGYMRISREKVSEFEWLSNPNTFYVFMRLLFKANFKDGRWEGIEVKRGQLITGRKALSGELNLSEQQIRTCLDKLEKTGYITIKPTNKYSVITICGYESWQNDIEVSNQQTNQQSTNNQPTNNQQITTIEELKEEINKLKKEKEELANASKKKEKSEKFDVRADLSYVDCFRDLWLEWLDYKDEIKKQYKTQRGASSAFTQLKNLALGDYGKAKAILEQSYRKSWDGFFDVKDYTSAYQAEPNDLFQHSEPEQPQEQTINWQ